MPTIERACGWELDDSEINLLIGIVDQATSNSINKKQNDFELERSTRVE